MLQSIRPFLLKFSARPQISAKLQEQQVIKMWQDIMASVHKSAREKSQALYLKDDGELVVQVANHLWLQELSLYKEDVRKRLSKKYPKVRQVRFVI